MLAINGIPDHGLIAENAADLATAFSNHYVVNATNQIIDQSDTEYMQFLGSLAGQCLAQAFKNGIPLNQLDSVLAQIRSFVIQSAGN